MSLVISKVFTYDTDAGDYIQRVEGASGDNQALEPATRQAINNFVIGCKQDGIWTAIKASCILSGARTLNGALQPLAGTAPTPFAFLEADYNRKTGLVGNGSSKYLNSNRNNNADPQNNQHMAVYATTKNSGTNWYMGAGVIDGGSTHLLSTSNIAAQSRNRNSSPDDFATLGTSLLIGMSRNNSSNYIVRSGSSATITRSSQTPFSANVEIYNSASSTGFFGTCRLAFYSIGESLDLALLDARVTALITAFGVAIP
jgi:hypothetical protein